MRPGHAQMQENPDETVSLIASLIIGKQIKAHAVQSYLRGRDTISIGGGGHHFCDSAICLT
jgi:hypothetical protein